MRKPWLEFYDKGVPQKLNYPAITLAEFLLNTATNHPDYIATTLDDHDMTYKEINEKVNGLANALRVSGIGRKDRVALILPNSPTYVIAFYAIMKLGAIVVNINVMTHGDELTSFLKDSGTTTVITLDLFLQNVLSVVTKTSLRKIVFHSVFGLEKKIDRDKAIPELIPFNDLLSAHPNDEPDLGCSSDDIAVLQFTGGTTGTPKAAALTHRNIVANVIQIQNWLRVPDFGNAGVMCIVPLFHAFGLAICLNLSVYMGFRMILIPRFDWSSILSLMEIIKKYRPVSFPAVPSLWAALVSFPEVRRYDLSSIYVASSGGAPLPVWVQKRYETLTGRKIVEAYGLTEASSTTHINPFWQEMVPASIGLPLPDTGARIVDIESGKKDCDIGEAGELIVSGPQIMQGYWGDPAATSEAIRGGWLYTGDLARMDDRGFFYIVDRKKDLIISSAFNVYPCEIEAVLLRHAKVKDAAVIGIPDSIRGETIAAFVVPEDKIRADESDVLAHCRKQLPAFKVPKSIKFIDEVPRNPAGKVLRRVLKEEIFE